MPWPCFVTREQEEAEAQAAEEEFRRKEKEAVEKALAAKREKEEAARRARMAEVPKEIPAGVIAHVRTVNKLKADLEARLNFLFNPD